jgi:hypothetical protein
MRSRRSTAGSVRPPPTSVTKMTVKVMKTIKSRCGKSEPFGRLSGIASAAASDTAPRRPDQATTSAFFQLGAAWSGGAAVGAYSASTTSASRTMMMTTLTASA